MRFEIADLVIAIYRPDHREPESPRAMEADLVIAKNRYGPTGISTVIFQNQFMRFTNMPPIPTDNPPSLPA
ncbi:DnaB-like helicase C-terminal domain-containing protein [Nonomuraea dietziae]|uniref:DnaB-like helicase C-terminal domain-containing protein n=1 Tax=Nonomuraea dietziae TaxID=65515 RepID=UPI00361142D5